MLCKKYTHLYTCDMLSEEDCYLLDNPSYIPTRKQYFMLSEEKREYVVGSVVTDITDLKSDYLENPRKMSSKDRKMLAKLEKKRKVLMSYESKKIPMSESRLTYSKS